MKTRGIHSLGVATAAVLVLSLACGSFDSSTDEPATTETVALVGEVDDDLNAEGDGIAVCENEAQISYLCGPTNSEDLLRIGDSDYLVGSGMDGMFTGAQISGSIHLINHQTRSYEVLFPGDTPEFEQDVNLFAECPGPLDVTSFSAHGLALREQEEAGLYSLYMTSHGAREAIEVFELDARNGHSVRWVGCVPMPATSWTNSLVILPDGGFFATQFMDPTGSGFQGVTDGEITGHVFEWHPGQAVEVLAGSELSGPNGIAYSETERQLFVAEFGAQQLVRFSLQEEPMSIDTVELGIAPDNIRWSSDGTLYTVGGNTTADCGGPECGLGWSVFEVHPNSLEATRVAGVDETAAMQGVSSALLVDDEIWIGTYGGDRLGVLAKP